MDKVIIEVGDKYGRRTRVHFAGEPLGSGHNLFIIGG